MKQLNRRQWGVAALGAGLVPAVAKSVPSTAWTPDWDRAVVGAALASYDLAFDAGESMIARRVGGDYNYHSALRNTVVHPTRDSLDYAMLLMEAGGEERDARARKIIDRTIALQDTDVKSRFYGIWGYHMEEPPQRMAPADFNWADFNGSTLLLIERRHGARLGEALRARVKEAIRHAAYSIKRRNVTMSYTNIAVQGTFVTLAAAKLLDDKELWAYATDRQRRFAANVDETGSFAEYNSPTYANVTIVNLTRIRMLVNDAEVLALNQKLHARAWMHLAKHWHAPTAQLAGPMSRCYSTDIGKPVWLQKALGGRLAFVTLDELRSGAVRGGGEVGVADYQCPPEAAAMFLKDQPARQHRELFLPAVQGTTWLEKDFTLGSINRGDFWIQRRPLVAYWGDASRPARYAQLRFLKDDYDFSSALFYGTQEKGRVLGLVNFRSPGGDKHISIDMVKNGEFAAKSLRLALVVSDPKAVIRLEGQRAMVEAGAVRMVFECRGGNFGGEKPELRVGKENGMPAVIVDFLKSSAARTVRWKEIAQAYFAFTLSMGASAGDAKFEARTGEGTIALSWGELELAGSTRVATAKEQDQAYRESRSGKPVETVRLDERRLV